MPALTRTPTVYVVGGYIPAGGAFMAYHLGLILHEVWSYPVVVVTLGAETVETGILLYAREFPVVPLDALTQRMTPDDILICNPSFSDLGLGLPGRKISYVQDYRTYRFLDRFFDSYVSVGDFVQNFLAQTYDLETDVIPPFIAVPEMQTPAWEERPPASLVISAKIPLGFFGPLHGQLRAALRNALSRIAPEIDGVIDWDGAHIQRGGRRSHRDFCQRLGQARFCLSLTPGEGFGLIPLEAMALGTVVLGFDGFGGRHYFRRGENCLVRRYPDVAGVAEDLATLMRDDTLAKRLSRAGQETAASYGYAPFRAAWIRKFTEILGPPHARRRPDKVAAKP